MKVIRDFRPTVIVTFDQTGGYGHPDHLAIHRWTTRAFHEAGDPTCYPDAGPAFAPGRLYYSAIPRSGILRLQEYLKKTGAQSVFSGMDASKMGMPDEMITNRINVKDYVQIKRKSMSEHKTQINPNGPFAKTPEADWNEWRSTEYFAYVAGTPIPAGSDSGDLFAGLR